jgi:hypothetical protein
VSARAPGTAARPAAAALAGYSGTPLPRKLGIKEGTRVALVGAPPGFETTLGELPAGALTRRGARGAADLTLWFVRSKAELVSGMRGMTLRGTASGLWICWAKRTSPLASDVGETDVRTTAIGAGLVDFKICALDADWSGLRFNLRGSASAARRPATVRPATRRTRP